MPLVDLTLRCPTCGKRADMCFDHGDDWKKRRRVELAAVTRAAANPTGTLTEVTVATAEAIAAAGNRDRAIRKAHEKGHSLRAIATAAGLSFARIHQITKHR